MNILVTGGAGFIGSNLCRKLLKEGNVVYCFDNFMSGSYDNIADLVNSHSNFHFFEFDITNDDNWVDNDEFEEIRFEQIYHLACPASPIAYQCEPLYTLNICTVGTKNILELAYQHNARILFTSTSEVYGDPEVSPQSEEYRGNVSTLGIRACYDEGKRIGETLFMEYNRVLGVDTRIARIFNTYGEYMSPQDGRVVSNFIVQCLRGEDITIYGNGNQTRSFCHVEDTVNGLCALMNKTNYCCPINIGNPNEITVEEFAHKIIELVGEDKPKIIYKDLPEDDPRRRCPDITKAKTYLEWTPKIDLEEGLKRTIEYFSNKLKDTPRLKYVFSACERRNIIV